MDELKSCPFCGIIPTRFTTDGLYYVKCSNPDCWICPQTAYYSESKTADTAWNDRLTPENKSLTNADRIRNMSNEELAVTLMCPIEMGMAEIECDHSDDKNCCKCLLNWLNKPEQEEK